MSLCTSLCAFMRLPDRACLQRVSTKSTHFRVNASSPRLSLVTQRQLSLNGKGETGKERRTEGDEEVMIRRRKERKRTMVGKVEGDGGAREYRLSCLLLFLTSFPFLPLFPLPRYPLLPAFFLGFILSLTPSSYLPPFPFHNCPLPFPLPLSPSFSPFLFPL